MPLARVRITLEFIAEDGNSIFKIRELSAQRYVTLGYQARSELVGVLARQAHASLRDVIYRGGLSDDYYRLQIGGQSDGVYEHGETREGDRVET